MRKSKAEVNADYYQRNATTTTKTLKAKSETNAEHYKRRKQKPTTTTTTTEEKAKKVRSEINKDYYSKNRKNK